MTVTVTERDNGNTVQAARGDVLEIHLAENATTGYRWQLEAPDPASFVVESADATYPPGVPGSGGTANFRVRVLSDGPHTLHLTYSRPWEKEAGVLTRYSLAVSSR